MKPFYVYIYTDTRKDKFTPIYVGMGTKGRRFDHLIYAANPFLRAVILKIRKAGFEPGIKVIRRFETEQEAFSFEKKLIAKYGRRDLGKGTLCNLTDGGDGVYGFVYTEEHRKAIKKLWKNKAIRGKRIASLREFYENNPEVGISHNRDMLKAHTSETKEKIRKNSLKAILKKDVRKRISDSVKKYYSENPEALKRLSEQGKKGKGKILSKETREKMSIAKCAQFKDPEFRAKWSKATFSSEAEAKRAETRKSRS